MLLGSIKRFVLLALQIVVFQFITAGTIQDSLLQLINNAKGDKEQAILYCSLAKSLQYMSVDSAVYYAQKGFELSQAAEYDLGMAEASAILGDVYVVTNRLEEAKKHYSNAVEFFKVTDHLFDVTQISMILGNIHLAQNEYLPALKLYQMCLDNSLENDFNSLTPHLYNNIGELYLEIEDNEAAKANFERAYLLFDKQKDQYNLAMCMLNLARISATNNNREEAIKGYLDAIRILSAMGSWPNIASAYNSIADLYIADGDYDHANEYLNLALNIIENNNSTFDGPSSIFSTRIFTNVAKLAFEKRDIKRALSFAKRSLKLSEQNLYKASILDNSKLLSRIYEYEGKIDSALVYYRTALEYTEQIQKEENIKKITQLRMQYEFDAMLRQKELEDVKRNAAHRQREMLYIGILVVVIFSIILLMLLYGNQKTKADRAILQKKNLELEKTKLNQALTYKNKELATNMMYLLEKNEFITTIARKLSEAKDAFNKSNQGVVQRIINELKQNSSKGIWEEFEMRFKEVHADFYKALTEKIPDLTPNEIRICAFLRLNMSTKEISAITHQSVKSIDMARFRLRKKMDIDRDENLITFLAQL
jgi:tetratricopeptide (TPR) repeat protein